MGIVSVTLKHDGASSKRDQAGNRTYTRTWIVITDSPHVGPQAVLDAVPVVTGMYYDTGTEVDTRAFCLALSAAPVAGDSKQWEVTAEYGPFDPVEFPENPMDRDPEISWDYQRAQEAAERDVDGNPIQNKAGDSFDPPLLKDVRRPILKLTRNEAEFDPALAYTYHDKINSTPFFGAGPGYVKVEGITPRRVHNQSVGWYWQVDYEFLFDVRTHDPEILNQGFKRIDGSGRRVVCTDDNGEVVSNPVWLDATGAQIPSTGTPLYLKFQIYPRIDFEVFNFTAFYNKLISYVPPPAARTRRLEGPPPPPPPALEGPTNG